MDGWIHRYILVDTRGRSSHQQPSHCPLSRSSLRSFPSLSLSLSWCPPCRTSIPHLHSLHQQYSKHGVTVLGVTNETDEAALRRFIQSMAGKMAYPVAMDAEDAMQRYSERYAVQGIPHAYVIDWLGRVRWHGHPMAGLADKLDVLVNERKQHLAKQATGPASGGGTAASGRAQGTAANELRAKSEQQLASQSVKELDACDESGWDRHKWLHREERPHRPYQGQVRDMKHLPLALSVYILLLHTPGPCDECSHISITLIAGAPRSSCAAWE